MIRRIRTTVLAAVAVAVSLPLAAQKPRLLRFDEPVQRLDTVREVDGAVRLRYAFTNVSPKPVALLDVHTQCGCFTPSWDRKPVPPGGRGVIEAVFDPKNRLRDFSIGLTVIATDGDYKKYNTLKVVGYVVSRIPEEEIFYPYVLSDAFRADVDAVGMRRFVPGDGPRERSIRLWNRSDRTLHPVYESGDRRLVVSGPSEIAPRTEAVVVFTFDPRGSEPGHFTLRPAICTEAGDTAVEIRGLIAEKEEKP